jgi:hypothetical protein
MDPSDDAYEQCQLSRRFLLTEERFSALYVLRHSILSHVKAVRSPVEVTSAKGQTRSFGDVAKPTDH